MLVCLPDVHVFGFHSRLGFSFPLLELLDYPAQNGCQKCFGETKVAIMILNHQYSVSLRLSTIINIKCHTIMQSIITCQFFK